MKTLPVINWQGFFANILPRIQPNERKGWLSRVNDTQQELPNISAPENGDPFHPLRIIDEIARNVPDDTIITTDVGQYQMWVAMKYPFSQPRTFLNSGGLGTMGFGVPTALGAALAKPEKKVVCFSGDGSFLMNIQELATIAEEQPNLAIVLYNNETKESYSNRTDCK